MDSTAAAALVEEAGRRASLVWVRRRGALTPPRPLWHAWIDGAAYVVTGGGEQRAPEDVADRGEVELTITSKDKRFTLITVPAAVAVVVPGSPEWERVVPVLRSQRQNLRDGDAALQRWAAEAAVLRLRPIG